MADSIIIRHVDKDLHRALKVRAAEQDKSLNALIIEILTQAMRKK